MHFSRPWTICRSSHGVSVSVSDRDTSGDLVGFAQTATTMTIRTDLWPHSSFQEIRVRRGKQMENDKSHDEPAALREFISKTRPRNMVTSHHDVVRHPVTDFCNATALKQEAPSVPDNPQSLRRGSVAGLRLFLPSLHVHGLLLCICSRVAVSSGASLAFRRRSG